MHGAGVALVTPFDGSGDVDHGALSALVDELEARGVDFVVPVGSTGESVLLTPDEQAAVIGTVADAASVPVLAGTGQPGRRATRRATERAADAGADAALVVTPYYYRHGQTALLDHYRALADAASIPVYAYDVPARTGVELAPESVAELAAHPNVAGMKDSTGDLDRLQRELALVEEEAFDVFVGHGGVLALALECGAAGGVNAVANVAPEAVSEVVARHRDGDAEGARAVNEALVGLNRAVTVEHGVPGLKAAMRLRGLPAGTVRAPLRPVDADVEAELEALVEAAGP